MMMNRNRLILLISTEAQVLALFGIQTFRFGRDPFWSPFEVLVFLQKTKTSNPLDLDVTK